MSQQRYGKVFNISAREEQEEFYIHSLRGLKIEPIVGEIKTKYKEGEPFDFSNVQVIAIYMENGVTKYSNPMRLSLSEDGQQNLSPWTSYPRYNEPLKADNNFVEFRYSRKGNYVSKRIDITVEKKYVSLPKQNPKQRLEYNGKEQSPVFLYENKYCYLDTTSELVGKDAGIYKARFILKDNYHWEDEKNLSEGIESKSREVQWVINPKEREVKTTTNRIIFNLNEPNERIVKTVYINYMGAGELEITKGLNSNQVSVRYTDREISFIVSKDFRYNSNSSCKFKIKPDPKGNYKESEEIEIKCYVSCWSWEDSEKRELATWLSGLQNYITYNSPDVDWIGKTKRLPISGINTDYNSSELNIRCIGINQDGAGTVTFMTEKTSALPKFYIKNPEEEIENPKASLELINYINDKFINNKKLFPEGNLDMLKSTNKRYWTGSDFQIAKNKLFFIPSAAELGITNSMLEGKGYYVGGYKDDYDIDEINRGNNYPYAYFITDENRVRELSDSNTNEKRKYWTRSTSDFDSLQPLQSKINSKQIIINTLGQPETVTKNTANIHYIFCFVIKPLEKKEVKSIV